MLTNTPVSHCRINVLICFGLHSPFNPPRFLPMLTVSFLGSRSRSRRSRDVLTLRASDSAINPPVLISFSLRSRRSSLGLSAMNSATATAPVEKIREKKMLIEILDFHWSRCTQARVPTFAGQFGGSKAQSQHRAVGNQSVFQLVDPFVTHWVMAEVQSLQTLGAWLKQQRRMKSFEIGTDCLTDRKYCFTKIKKQTSHILHILSFTVFMKSVYYGIRHFQMSISFPSPWVEGHCCVFCNISQTSLKTIGQISWRSSKILHFIIYKETIMCL